jgi:hypothetical protein
MVTDVTTPLTARDLFALVAPFAPGFDGEELMFGTDFPIDLVPALGVLHTGVRAVLTGRVWWGASTKGKPRVAELRTDAPIPEGIGLLCVAGDRRWDRIAPGARFHLPHLFATVPSGPSARARRVPRTGNSQVPGES